MMSERFGLDWIEHDFQRMYALMIAVGETEKKKNKGAGAQAKPGFRPRF